MALESHLYGNPERVLEAKQAREARDKRKADSRIVVDPSRYWSPARQAAEALFTGIADECSTPSEARRRAEALFES